MKRGKDRKKIIKDQHKHGLIPDDLLNEINSDIESYLEKEVEKNQEIIDEILSKRIHLGLPINFTVEEIINKLTLLH